MRDFLEGWSMPMTRWAMPREASWTAMWPRPPPAPEITTKEPGGARDFLRAA